MTDLKAHCFNPNCDEVFDSVNEMVAVPGRGSRSPRHFCESCAERIRRGPPMTDGGQIVKANQALNVVNGHHLRATKHTRHRGDPTEWQCRGCETCFDSRNIGEGCAEPTTWVQMGAPEDGLGRCRECETLFVFAYESPFYEQRCPECGSIDWYRTDETEPEPSDVTAALNCSLDTATERTIQDIAHDYLRAVEEHKAKTEELLAEWAEEYYRPGYLDDSEWQRLKDLLKSGETDHALMQLEIACYRKAATELGRADEFDDDWPAKNRGESSGS